MIGEIELNREFSFFEVEKSSAKKVRKGFNNAKLDGRSVQVQKVFKKKNQTSGAKRASAN
jgi:ATP-dependent RNA helicase DeaD